MCFQDGSPRCQSYCRSFSFVNTLDHEQPYKKRIIKQYLEKNTQKYLSLQNHSFTILCNDTIACSLFLFILECISPSSHSSIFLFLSSIFKHIVFSFIYSFCNIVPLNSLLSFFFLSFFLSFNFRSLSFFLLDCSLLISFCF